MMRKMFKTDDREHLNDVNPMASMQSPQAEHLAKSGYNVNYGAQMPLFGMPNQPSMKPPRYHDQVMLPNNMMIKQEPKSLLYATQGNYPSFGNVIPPMLRAAAVAAAGVVRKTENDTMLTTNEAMKCRPMMLNGNLMTKTENVGLGKTGPIYSDTMMNISPTHGVGGILLGNTANESHGYAGQVYGNDKMQQRPCSNGGPNNRNNNCGNHTNAVITNANHITNNNNSTVVTNNINNGTTTDEFNLNKSIKSDTMMSELSTSGIASKSNNALLSSCANNNGCNTSSGISVGKNITINHNNNNMNSTNNNLIMLSKCANETNNELLLHNASNDVAMLQQQHHHQQHRQQNGVQHHQRRNEINFDDDKLSHQSSKSSCNNDDDNEPSTVDRDDEDDGDAGDAGDDDDDNDAMADDDGNDEFMNL